MAERYSVSVVICAYADERQEQLCAALGSLSGQGAAEIILVIDHNPALLQSMAERMGDIMVVANTGARGLSGARNTGVAMARGSIIAFLDDDAIAEPGWIAGLQAHYEDHTVIGVGGRVVPQWPQARPGWFPPEFDWVIGCSYIGLPEQVGNVRNLIGCNMSFRAGVLARIPPFREGTGRKGDNGSGCEETELCINASLAFPEGRIVYDPALVVRHCIAEARTHWTYFRARCLAEGRSKALMTAMVGKGRGLSSERRYATRVLPAGVVEGLLACNADGVRRAAAIVAGLALVLYGYLSGSRKQGPKPVLPAFEPLRIVDIDVDQPLSDIAVADPVSGERYGAAFCVARSGGRPVAILEIPFYGEDIASSRLGAVLPADGVRASPRLTSASVGRPQRPFCRVVVATRDRPAALAVCVDSLLAQRGPAFEIVVVDNAPSSSDTANLIDQRYAGISQLRYRREDRPGLGQAHNCGIADLGADPAVAVVAFTDDDVIADAGWLDAIAANFTAQGQVGCVTGLILPAELQTRAQYWTERHGGFGKGLARQAFDLDANRGNDILFPYAAGRFGSGANMAFSREALLGIDGFDSALGAGTPARGGDDLAAFVAVIQAGYQIVYEPGAIVWHHHRRSEEGMARQAYGYGVGLGAYLTKVVVEDPLVGLHFAAALPAALVHIMGKSSAKNNRLPADYPAALRWSERRGILAGVPAYFRSRAALHRQSGPRKSEPAANGRTALWWK